MTLSTLFLLAFFLVMLLSVIDAEAVEINEDRD